ncbi:ATP-binding protein [Candidatus Omnitrophota bacterium]
MTSKKNIQKNSEEETVNLSRFPSENPNPVLRIRKNGEVLYKNPAADLLLKRSGLSARSIFGILPRNSKQIISQSIKNKFSFRNQEVIIGGKVFAYNFIPVPEGQYVNIYGLEVTEQKIIEDELRVSERKYRGLYDTSRDAIMVLIPQGRFISGNPATIKLFACKDEADFIRHTPARLSPRYQSDGKLSSEKARKMMAIAMKKGSHYFEWRHKRTDGTEFPATVLLTRMEFEDANLLQATVRDITLQKESELRIGEAAKEWSRTFDSIVDCVSIMDKNFNIIRVNRAFADFLKLKPEEIIGKKCYKLVHKTNGPIDLCPHRQTLRNKKVSTAELAVSDSGPFLDVSTSPVLNEQGKVVASVHIIRDITNRKRAENILEQTRRELENQTLGLKKANAGIRLLNKELEGKNKQLRKIDELKSEFISVVSHELRTPLAITKEGISLILDGVPGEVNEKQQNILSTARSSIDRLARIINDLLDVSKIEAGRIELERDMADLKELLRVVILSFDVRFKQKGIRLRSNLPLNPVVVFIDKDRIVQVLTNLLSNAMKFTKEGYVEVSLQDAPGEVTCSVVDSGIGISKEDIPKLFGKFQQFGRTAGPGEKGTGLGLSISKGIIQMHGGKIQAESELGKGTKISFTLSKHPWETLFKQIIAKGIKLAQTTDSKMSAVIISFSGLDKIRKQIPRIKLSSVLTELKKVVRNTLGKREDLTAEGANQCLVILEDCDKGNMLAVKKGFAKALDRFFAEQQIADKVKSEVHFVTFPDDGENEEELYKKILILTGG